MCFISNASVTSVFHKINLAYSGGVILDLIDHHVKKDLKQPIINNINWQTKCLSLKCPLSCNSIMITRATSAFEFFQKTPPQRPFNCAPRHRNTN